MTTKKNVDILTRENSSKTKEEKRKNSMDTTVKTKVIDALTPEVLHREYFTKERSTTDIAAEYGTNPKRISRLLKKFGYVARTRAEAQAIVVRELHPTRGKERTDEEKKAISQGGAASWDDDRREQASQIAKDQWETRTEEDKAMMRQKAAVGLRESAMHGSKLEKRLMSFLVANGYGVLHHKMALPNHNLEVDLWLTNDNIVIEVDGVYHVNPIHGEDKLAKQQGADERKNNLLTKNGFSVIRLIVTKKHISDNDYGVIEQKTLELIKKVKPGKVTRWTYE
jgi:very-short-patch-repair endonuclease